MYVVLVYDVDQRRVAKMLKLCRRYLHWIQNSVFEGEMTAVKLKELIYAAKTIMEDQDSLIVFKSRDNRWLQKEVHGNERNRIENIL